MPMEKSGTYVKKKIITIKLSSFASPAVGKNSDRNCTQFYTKIFCRARWDWDNLTEGIFPCHKLQGVFTGVGEWIHVLLNITHRSMFAQGLEYRYWRQSAQFIMTERVRNKSVCMLKTNKQTKKQTKTIATTTSTALVWQTNLSSMSVTKIFFFKNSQWSYGKYYAFPSTIHWWMKYSSVQSMNGK